MWKYWVMFLIILYESTSQIVMCNPICSRQNSIASVWEEAYIQSVCGAQKLSSQTLENESWYFSKQDPWIISRCVQTCSASCIISKCKSNHRGVPSQPQHSEGRQRENRDKILANVWRNKRTSKHCCRACKLVFTVDNSVKFPFKIKTRNAVWSNHPASKRHEIKTSSTPSLSKSPPPQSQY